MEAVPRLPMLSFDLKVSSEPASFGPKLKQFIRDVYHEDPEAYSSEILALENLRASAVKPLTDITSISTLKKYYCQLHFLKSRFPMAKDGAACVTFTWKDTYTNVVYSLANIHFEMMCILYNIGALHSQLGALDSRSTSDGMKLACTHFQCAAWAFQHLKELFPQPAGVDSSPEMMQFMYYIMLAQAQECILEKSMMDNRKATIIAKVAVQIAGYYSQALKTLAQGGTDDPVIAETVTSKVYKSWKRYVKFKMSYHTCLALLYQGQQAEEMQKMGERVAFYQAASEMLQEAIALSKGMENAEAINETLTFTMDVVEGKKKAAKNENEFIYHEQVPDKDQLPELKGASLVKGIMFNVNDPEVSGPDIFARLVPMKAHEASSVYSEEKAKLLRKVSGFIEDKDKELDLYMTSLQLDHMTIFSEPERLPQELIERCAALSAQPNAIQDLVEAMGKLADIYQDVEGMLQEIKELLEVEEVREREYQKVMGSRPPSIVATELTAEANKYQEAHAKASESNETLHKAMTLNIENLKLLSLSLAELEQQLPSIKSVKAITEDPSMKELKHLVAKVDEMRQQRIMLAAQLRESVCQDDITSQLAAHNEESFESIFHKEIQKHRKYVDLIEQNLLAQDNILKALTDVYAHNATVRKTIIEVLRKREAVIKGLISSYDAYEDLLAKSHKGSEFYRKLERNVTKLLQRIKGTCKVQDEEREQILAKNKKSIPSIYPAKDTKSTGNATTASSGPKLRDYLESMKQAALESNIDNSSVNSETGYYNVNIVRGYTQVPPSASPQPSSFYDQSSGTVPAGSDTSGSQQWIPLVRPAPVGSEGTPEQTSSLPRSSVKAYSENVPSYAYTNPKYSSYEPTVSKESSEYYMPSYPYISNSASQLPAVSLPSHYGQAYPEAAGQTFINSAQYMYHNQQNQIDKAYQYSSVPPGTPYQYPVSTTATPTSYSLEEAQQKYASDMQQQQYPSYVHQQQNYSSTYPQQQHSSATQPLQQMPLSAIHMQQQYTSMIPHQQYSNVTPHVQQYPADGSKIQKPADTSQMQHLTDPSKSELNTGAPQIQQPSISQIQQHPLSISQVHQNSPSPSLQQQYSTGMSLQQQQDAGILQQQVQSLPGASLHQHSPEVFSQQQFVGTQQQHNIQEQSVPTSHVTFSSSHPALSDQQQMSNQVPGTGHSYSLQTNPSTQQTFHTETPEPSTHTSQPSSNYATYSYGNNYSAAYTPNYTAEDNSASSHPSSGQLQWQQISQQTYSPASTPVPGNEYHMVQSESSSNIPVANSSSHQATQSSDSNQYENTNMQYVYTSSSQHVTIPVTPYSQTLGKSSYQYMSVDNSASSYTSAGNNVTSQTQSSNVAVNGQTFADQYHANQSTEIYSGYDQSQYYITQYGQQYDTNYGNNANLNTNYHYNGINGQQQQSPMTYMQAATSNMSTSTTNSSQGESSSVKSSIRTGSGAQSTSNVDLLAGLDFPVNQAPLLPQTPVTHKTESKLKPSTFAAGSPAMPVTVSATITATSESSPAVVTPNLQNSTSASSIMSSSSNEDIISTIMKRKQDASNSKSYGSDPYTDPDSLNLFVQEVEKFEKFVESLTTKTLNGPTPLDLKWKEILELQDKDAHKRNISVARCYPMKNRFPDILPYDHSRVELPSTKDDYINASHMKDITPLTPPFIVTQAPLPSTYSDFWTMIWEQQVEVIACLLSDKELEGDVYWPAERNKELHLGQMRIILQTCNTRSHWIERIISVYRAEKRISRAIVHLQFTTWPGSSFPASPGPFLGYVSEVLSLYRQQRGSSHPVVIHCSSGVGRTGLFCLIAAAICEIQASRGILDLVTTTVNMSLRRKNSLRDREHLKFAYQSLLYFAQDLLMKRGILTSRSTFEDKRSREGKCHTRHPSEDFLLGPPADLNQLQSGLEKMGLGSKNKSSASEVVQGPNAAKATHDSSTSDVTHSQKGEDQSVEGSDAAGASTTTSSSSSCSQSPLHKFSNLLDPSQFDLKLEPNVKKPAKRVSRESFDSMQKLSTLSAEGQDSASEDPLSSLDPLWTLKKN